MSRNRRNDQLGPLHWELSHLGTKGGTPGGSLQEGSPGGTSYVQLDELFGGALKKETRCDMADKSSTKRAELRAEIAKRVVIALSVRALWAVIAEVFFHRS